MSNIGTNENKDANSESFKNICKEIAFSVPFTEGKGSGFEEELDSCRKFTIYSKNKFEVIWLQNHFSNKNFRISERVGKIAGKTVRELVRDDIS